MTRIISGTAGGRRLATPPGAGTRPTSERVREALFSRLDHLDVLSGARVLDLYAGSGALGLEALSRGAADAVLVESARGAADVARRNVRTLGLPARVLADTAERALAGAAAGPFDLAFLDLPYDIADEALAAVLGALVPRLAPGAVVVVERSTRSGEPAWPTGLAAFADKAYGETALWFAEPVDLGPGSDAGSDAGSGAGSDDGPDDGSENEAEIGSEDEAGAGSSAGSIAAAGPAEGGRDAAAVAPSAPRG